MAWGSIHIYTTLHKLLKVSSDGKSGLKDRHQNSFQKWDHERFS